MDFSNDEYLTDDDDNWPQPDEQLAGLNMRDFTETIRSDRNIWHFVSELGVIFIWNGNSKNLYKISNVNNQRLYIGNETNIFWERLPTVMQKNEFVLVTIKENGRATLYNCHRFIARVKDGQNIIFFSNVSIWIGLFSDSAIPNSSKFKVDRMRHIFLKTREFRIRVQSDSNKIFIRNDDIIRKNIDLNWIQQLPLLNREE